MSTTVTADPSSYLRGLLGPAVLLPWPTRSKGDRRRWKHLQLADMNEANHLAKLERAGNIGVALGQVSNGLVTIDLDNDSQAYSFLAANPLLRDTLQTRASRGCNVWLRCAGDYPRSCNLIDQSGTKIGELRGDGCQTIIIGTHPSGVAYRFVVEKPVIKIRYDAIIWPDSIVAPHATESKRSRRE